MSLFTIFKKVILNVLHILENVSFSTCTSMLQDSALFREPLSVFTNFHNTLGVLFELVIML
jgi:hypothetical protein